MFLYPSILEAITLKLLPRVRFNATYWHLRYTFNQYCSKLSSFWRKIYGKLGIPLSSKHLPVQSQQYKHLKKAWNMCKFNSNNTRTISLTSFWCVYYWLWAYFTPFYWCLYRWLWTNKCLFCDNLFVTDWNSSLTLSWRRPLSYRNHLQSKSMDWFLYDNGLRHERVKWRVISICLNNLEQLTSFSYSCQQASLVIF